jgi:hypothetical protein
VPNVTETVRYTLRRLDMGLAQERGRVGLMQRWLEDHTSRLEDLSGRIEASLARIDLLLEGAQGI